MVLGRPKKVATYEARGTEWNIKEKHQVLSGYLQLRSCNANIEKSSANQYLQHFTYLGCGPPPSNSDHKEELPFLIGDPYKPLFATGMLRGGAINSDSGGRTCTRDRR